MKLYLFFYLKCLMFEFIYLEIDLLLKLDIRERCYRCQTSNMRLQMVQ